MKIPKDMTLVRDEDYEKWLGELKALQRDMTNYHQPLCSRHDQ